MSAPTPDPPAVSRKAVAGLLLAGLSLALGAWAAVPAGAAGACAVVVALFALRDVGRAGGALRGGFAARGAIAVGTVAGMVFLLVVPAVRQVRRAAERTTLV
jgi:hypothetical protein